MKEAPAASYSAHDVAAELRRQLPGAGDVKVHKLLYYCQGWYLAWSGKPLFREAVHAWANGPVVADLWHDEDKGRDQTSKKIEDKSVLTAISFAVSKYGRLTGTQLIRLTHGEDPWLNASYRNAESGRPDDEIPAEQLEKFFRNELEHSLEGRAAYAASADNTVSTQLRQDADRLNESLGEVDSPSEIQRRLNALV